MATPRDPMKAVKGLDPAMLHVGLRKGTDSPWSSLLWNAVNASEHREWGRFVEYVNLLIGLDLEPLAALRRAMRMGPYEVEERAEALGRPIRGKARDRLTTLWRAWADRSGGRVIGIAFEMADEQTLTDMLAFHDNY